MPSFGLKMRRCLGPVTAISLVLLANLTSFAHQLPEERHVIVSLSPTSIDLLVAYEQPAGSQAAELRGLIDMDGSGAVDGPLEELARAQLLVPRLTKGMELTVDDEVVVLDLERVDFRDGAGEGPRQGFEGLALYRAEWTFEPGRPMEVSLSVAHDVFPVVVELQVLEGLTLVSSAQPPAPDAPVIGPVEVQPGLQLTVVVQANSAMHPPNGELNSR